MGATGLGYYTFTIPLDTSTIPGDLSIAVNFTDNPATIPVAMGVAFGLPSFKSIGMVRWSLINAMYNLTLNTLIATVPLCYMMSHPGQVGYVFLMTMRLNKVVAWNSVTTEYTNFYKCIDIHEALAPVNNTGPLPIPGTQANNMTTGLIQDYFMAATGLVYYTLHIGDPQTIPGNLTIIFNFVKPIGVNMQPIIAGMLLNKREIRVIGDVADSQIWNYMHYFSSPTITLSIPYADLLKGASNDAIVYVVTGSMTSYLSWTVTTSWSQVGDITNLNPTGTDRPEKASAFSITTNPLVLFIGMVVLTAQLFWN